jgi:ABC-type dipeptide/oligopeptide/nickel transport system permease component
MWRLRLPSYKVEFNKRVLVKNIIFSFAIPIMILFIGLTINFFFIYYGMPGDPVIAYLPPMYTQEQYDAMYSALGFDQPIIAQYFRYLSEMFSGNWRISSSYIAGMPVWDIMAVRFPRMIELLLLPTILGLIIGIILGKISNVSKRKWVSKVIQGYTVAFLAIPIFSLGLFFQISAYQSGWPVSGYKTMTYSDPPFNTGFLILDALLADRKYLADDIAKHFVLPVLALILIIIPLITMMTRSTMAKKRQEKSIISNTSTTALSFGLIFTFYILIDSTFNLAGLATPFLYGVGSYDYYLLRGIIFSIICLLVVIIFISSVISSISKSLTFHRQDTFEINVSPNPNNDLENNPSNDLNQIEKNPGIETESKRNLKKYLRYIYKSPFLLIGLVIVIVFVILASFPELISGYSLQATQDFYPNPEHPTQVPYMPPSSEYPLGTTYQGRDLFAVVLWGTQHALLIGLVTLFIGVVGGLLFGFISSLHRYVNKAIEAIMIITCVIPMMILILMTISFFGHSTAYFIIPMGILLIPIFTRIIANPPLEEKNVISSLKKLLIYIPLILGFVILFYQTFAFLGFQDNGVVEISEYINLALAHKYNEPWAILWPGAFIYLTVFGFIALHIGLKNTFLDRNLKSPRITDEAL